MRLLRLDLENFCKFDKATFEFSPGLNCIKGANGSGKSTILQAIYSCLSGDFSPFSGPKPSNIKYNSSGTASIQLIFEHLGETVTVRRYIKAKGGYSESYLQLGKGKFFKEKEISSKLQQLLGINSKVLKEYVFVQQWKMFQFLTATESERIKVFQNIFGIDLLDEIWTKLGEVPQPESEITDLASIKSKLKEQLAEKAAKEAELKELHFIPDDYSPETDPNNQIIKNYEEKLSLQEKENLLLEDAKSLRRSIEEYDKLLGSLYQNERDIRQKLSLFDDNLIAQVNEKLAKIQDYYKQNDAFNLVSAEVTRYQNELNSLIADKPENYIPDTGVVDPAKPIDLTNFRDKQTYLYVCGQIRLLSKLAEIGSELNGQSQCPLCDNVLTEHNFSEEKRREKMALLDKYKAIYSEINPIWEASRAYDQKYSFLSSKLAEAQSKLDLMPVPQKPDFSETELFQFVNAKRQLDDDLAALQKRLQDVLIKRTQFYEKFEATSKELEKTRRQLSNITVTESDAAAARQQILSFIKLNSRKRDLIGEIKVIEKNIDNLKTVLAEFELKIQQQLLKNASRKHIHLIRNVFQKNNLPKLVLSHYINSITDEINLILQDFNADFSVKLLPESLSFEAIFTDGTIQPADRLSGGQKVLLALAFRIVINSVFAGEAGLLCLDEPTVGLDVKNMRCFEVALNKLKELSHKNDLQVLLVTHEHVLDSLFDKIIYL